jgi:tRNA(Ile)-lysidine synthase
VQPLVAVATSGGRDSTALLHACARAARGSGLRVLALHVHHGLMPQADEWVRHLRRQCGRWARAGLPVTLVVRRLTERPQPGDSVEAWARRERYDALAALAIVHGASLVLLAHHRTDQAETVLLQALRAAGAAGMAGMGREKSHAGVQFIRPWLDMPRSAIDAYVRQHRLGHVDDTSNADARFARSRLRVQVWPALTAAFPHAEAALAGTARRLHEVDACARDLARQDLVACVGEGGALGVRAWCTLAPHRQSNVLRHWLAQHLSGGVPDSLVHRLARELPRARGRSRWPAPGGFLQLLAGGLVWTGEVRVAASANDAAPQQATLE